MTFIRPLLHATPLLLMVLARPEQTEEIMSAIRNAALTGKIGDGIVWAQEFKGYRRIRTGEWTQSGWSMESAGRDQLLDEISRVVKATAELAERSARFAALMSNLSTRVAALEKER